MRVQAVTAWVPMPIPFRHQTVDQYKQWGASLSAALPGKLTTLDPYPFTDCWVYQWLKRKPLDWVLTLTPMTAGPADRFVHPHHMLICNIVQHERTTWARKAAWEHPKADVVVYIDYGVLKQGDFTGRRVHKDHISAFVQRIEAQQIMDDIPFPGCWVKGTPCETDANWRFVGSTHIWPRKYLDAIDKAYKEETIKFIERTNTIPLDLPIWAAVEQRGDLPFRQYVANHDATQFTNY